MIKTLFRQSWYSYKAVNGDLTVAVILLSKVLNPFFTLAFLVFMTINADPSRNILGLVLANSLLMCTYTIFFQVAVSLRVERTMGTLKCLFVAPTSNLTIYLSKGLVYFFDAFVIVVVMMIISIIAFNVDLSRFDVNTVLLCFVVGIYSAFCFGLAFAPLNLILQEVHIVTNTLWYLLIVFSGTHFSIDKIPVVFHWIPQLLPLSRTTKSLRILAEGGINTWPQIWPLLGMEFLLGTSYLIAGGLIKTTIERKAQKEGNFDLYY